jgi:ABC-type branched-subunit amino acid transport system ATPase component
MSALLEAEGIVVRYGRLTILDRVGLSVAAGEMVALLGTNGAGKSTLLRAISGVVPIRAGRVRLAGEDVTGRPPAALVRKGVAHLPGGRAVFPGMSVVDNLRVACAQVPRRERPRRIDEAIARFGWLAERREQLAGSLSGGQRQMLGLAMALVAEPRVVLIDELSLGLAPVVVDELLHTLAGLRAGGTAVVVVEQHIDLALGVADRAVFLERGRVRFAGPAQGLRGRTDLLRAVLLTGGATPVGSEA